MPPVIDPKEAMVKILQYAVENGMTTLTITATLQQRLLYQGNISITSLVGGKDYSLDNVLLPNLVISKTLDIVKYDVVVQRVNLV